MQKIEKLRTKFATSESKTLLGYKPFFKLGVIQNIHSKIEPITQLEKIEPKILIEFFSISYNLVNDVDRPGFSFSINYIDV